MTVSIPAGADGFFGRQCPSSDCGQVFRIDDAAYEALPDGVELYCPYCGHHGVCDDFITRQQSARSRRIAENEAGRVINRKMDQTLRRLAGRSRPGSLVQISYRSQPFRPRPVPALDEELLIRVRTCTSCTLPYAVFAEHRFCPVCGPMAPDVVARDALAALTTRIEALDHLPAATAALLRESGGLTQAWISAVTTLPGIVEAYAKAVFHATVPDAAARTPRSKGNVFQRLDDAAALFVAAGHPDLRAAVGTVTWRRLVEAWAIRHVYVHNDGVIDNDYVRKVPAAASRIGQRVPITAALCRQSMADTATLLSALAAIAAAP